MPRPAPHRLTLENYPVREIVQTRFQDLDPLGHLNNVAFAALFENARVRFNWAIGGINRDARKNAGFRGVVAMCAINYLAEGNYPADVEIATGVGTIGNRSWEVLAVMHQGGRAIASCDTVIVMTHPTEGGLPADFRAALEGKLVREV